MTDVSELLVPLDGTAETLAGLRVAADISKLTGIPVSGMVVSSPHGDEAGERAWLDDRAARVGIELRRRVVTPGFDVPRLVVEATHEPGSLLCLATHGRSGVAELVLGSEGNEIVRAMVGPVLLVGPQVTPVERFERIMVCFDGSPVAEQALHAAVELATSLHMSLHLVQVVDTDSSLPADLAEDRPLQLAARRLSGAGLAIDWETLHSSRPARAIVVRADEIQADLLVMGTHGRSGLRAITMGSVANEVVRHAHQPVLVFHPAIADAESARHAHDDTP